MNEKRREEYAELKDGIMVTESAISDCRGRIVRIESDINQKRSTIAYIKAKLEAEDRAIASASILDKPTMKAEQYLANQGTIETIEDQLPELNKDLEYQSRQLVLLESKLRDKRRALKYARELFVAALVEKSINDLSAVASNEVNNLVMATIASAGKARGYYADDKEAYKRETYRMICEKILKNLFDRHELPDLPEANQYVDAILDTAA